MSKEKDELLDHEYDGIQEYDNDLPRWWVNIFWITTVYAIGYTLWVHVLSEETQHEQLARELAELEASRAAVVEQASASGGDDTQMLKALVSDSAAMGRAKAKWDGNCKVCHGSVGEGLVGPNLTDDNWIHGGSIIEVRHIIRKGVVEKGMIAWEASMTPAEINEMTAFVWSLYGSNPANAKAAEGELVPRN